MSEIRKYSISFSHIMLDETTKQVILFLIPLLLVIFSCAEGEEKHKTFAQSFVEEMMTHLERNLESTDQNEVSATLKYCDDLGCFPFTSLVSRALCSRKNSFARKLVVSSPYKYTEHCTEILSCAKAEKDIELLACFCGENEVVLFKSLFAASEFGEKSRALLGFCRSGLHKDYLDLCRFLKSTESNSSLSKRASLVLAINNEAVEGELKKLLLNPGTREPWVLANLADAIEKCWRDGYSDSLVGAFNESSKNLLWLNCVFVFLLHHAPYADISPYFAASKYLDCKLDIALARWILVHENEPEHLRDFLKALIVGKNMNTGNMPVNSAIAFQRKYGGLEREIALLSERDYRAVSLQFSKELFSLAYGTENLLPRFIGNSFWQLLISDLKQQRISLTPVEAQRVFKAALNSSSIGIHCLKDVYKALEEKILLSGNIDFDSEIEPYVSQFKKNFVHPQRWVMELIPSEELNGLMERNKCIEETLITQFIQTGENWIARYIAPEEISKLANIFLLPGIPAISGLEGREQEVTNRIHAAIKGCEFGSCFGAGGLDNWVKGDLKDSVEVGDFRISCYDSGVFVTRKLPGGYTALRRSFAGEFRIDNTRISEGALYFDLLSANKQEPPFVKLSEELWKRKVAVIQADRDVDGLQQWIEYYLKFSDDNPDFDGDSVPDGLDPSPTLKEAPVIAISMVLLMQLGLCDRLPLSAEEEHEKRRFFSTVPQIPVCVVQRQQITGTGRGIMKVKLPYFEIREQNVVFYRDSRKSRGWVMIGEGNRIVGVSKLPW